MPNPFATGVRPWARRTVAKIASATSPLGAGELMTDEAGNVYGGDGSTAIKALSRLLRKSEIADLYVNDYAAAGFTWGVDDTAPWQAAIDAARALGGKARVHAHPGRVYQVNPIKLYSNVDLDGHGATIKPITRVGGTNIWDALLYTAGCPAANGCTGDGTTQVFSVRITDFIFDTQSKVYATVKAQNADAIAVRHCSFPTNQQRIAIRFDQNTSRCVAESNRIVSTLDDPFGTVPNAQGISVASSVVDSTAGAYGAYQSPTVDTSTFTDPTNLSQQHHIVDNWIEGGTHGVALQGAESCTVQGNTILNTSHRGIIASPVSHRNVIVGNSVRGTFSCGILIAFGSRFNVVSSNIAYCIQSVSEQNAFRASYGASDNHFVGNYAYGVTGAAFRTFTGACNNSFVGNKAENCGVGLEFRSINPDNGYQQNANTPDMVGNVAQGNQFIGCAVGIILRGASTVTTSNMPATTAKSIPLRNCSVVGNSIHGATTNSVQVIEDTAGSVTALVALANATQNGPATDWQTPRAAGHFTNFRGNQGSGMPEVQLAPATGNTWELRDSTNAILAFISNVGAIVTKGRRAAGASVASTIAIDYVNTTSPGQIGSRVDGQAGQTADLAQWTVGAGPSAAVQSASRVNYQGALVTSVHAAPPDSNLMNGDLVMWFDQTNGAAKVMFKAKQADGTVRTGSIPLT